MLWYWAKDLTHLQPGVYKMSSGEFNADSNFAMDCHSLQEEKEIFLVAPGYRKRLMLLPDEPLKKGSLLSTKTVRIFLTC